MNRSSPGALTVRRFFRNRLAVTGLLILGIMFAFSFLGGALTPYGQDQVFYREELRSKEVAGVTQNTAYRFLAATGQSVDAVLQARFALAAGNADSFTHHGAVYTVKREGQDLYSLYGEELLGIVHKDILTPALPFEETLELLRAYAKGEVGSDVTVQGQQVHISRLVIQPEVDRDLRQQVELALRDGRDSFEGYSLHYDAANRAWSLRQDTVTRVWDSYAPPSWEHPLGTDKNGMDMLTRLMYGGRVSLVIGFAVVAIAGALGVVLGGFAGYFGGWVDNAIMRLVDVFYCIPSTPMLIILGAAMDAMRVDPRLRMALLMLVLGLLGWPVIARLVRGQILSLREQEFMVAAEAVGLGTGRRIFRHLLPNVVPQLIVQCTMSLGSTILTEATLSFLGLGVKFPFASWGNMVSDVSNAHVLTNYWFVWIPAGLCLVLAVLGFNFVGDGLRDAFDPRMRR